MALSNWDTLSFGSDGKPNDGSISTFDGNASVSLYKNWLHVSDSKAWHANGSFIGNIIAKVEEGEIEISGFSIAAVRGPQNSVICYIVTRNIDNYSDVKRMFGIGGYGYSDPLDKILKDNNIVHLMIKYIIKMFVV